MFVKRVIPKNFGIFGVKTNKEEKHFTQMLEKLSKFLKREEIETLDFLKHFYGIKKEKEDFKNLQEFCRLLELFKKRKSVKEISRLMNRPPTTLSHWLHQRSAPYIIHLVKNYMDLGKPKKGMWLSLNSTKGGIFSGPWIEVPKKVIDGIGIKNVLNKIKSFPIEKNIKEKFQKEPKKEMAFAYILGVLVGDASKYGIKRKRRITRRIQLRLTKKYVSNLQLGSFFCVCMNICGLRINRGKDCPKGKRNVHDFYAWHSQCSSFIQWIFDACLGLKENELTTYNAIRAKWILRMNNDFKITFIQGIADSDGFVDFSAIQSGILTGPNTKLAEKILTSLGIKSRRKFFSSSNLWALMISIEDAFRLPLFNKEVNSYRYREVNDLHKGKRIKRHWQQDLKEEVDKHIRGGFKGTQIVRKILEHRGVIVRCKGINRRVRKMKEKEEFTCLGIESTAQQK